MARTPRPPSFPRGRSSAPSPAGPPAVRLPRLLLRATATGAGVLGLAQAALAGSFLNGHYEALLAHETTATALGGLLLLQLPVAALVRRGGGAAGVRGPWWPLGAAVLLLAAFGAQSGTGYERAVGVHVTLGVLLVSGLLFGLVGAWRLPLAPPSPVPDAAPAAPAATEDGDGDGSGRLPRPAGGDADAVEVTP